MGEHQGRHNICMRQHSRVASTRRGPKFQLLLVPDCNSVVALSNWIARARARWLVVDRLVDRWPGAQIVGAAAHRVHQARARLER